jgi:Protein of unknown function (DUF2865)
MRRDRVAGALLTWDDSASLPMAGHFFCARNQGSLLAVLHEVRHAAEVDRRSSICRRISIIVDRRWSALSQAHRDWPDVYADVSKHDGPMLHCRRAIIRAGRNSSSLEVATSPRPPWSLHSGRGATARALDRSLRCWQIQSRRQQKTRQRARRPDLADRLHEGGNLCDGRYFPIQRHNGVNLVQTCSSFCPASATKIYSGNSINHAVAPDGKRYSELATAFAYREKIIPGCTCNGRDAFGLVTTPVADDPTLRPGDIVATNARSTKNKRA